MEFLPSALIIDQTLVQGFENALKTLPYHLPVISFTFPSSANYQQHLPECVSNYLIKPVSRQMLAETVYALGPLVHTILVVDGDPAMVRFTMLALNNGVESTEQPNSYRLQTASSGAEALNLLQTQLPDAILLDPSLSDIDGWQLLADLQHTLEQANVPVIIVTAQDKPLQPAINQAESLRVFMGRSLSRHELATVLQGLLKTIQPDYPTTSKSKRARVPNNKFRVTGF